MKNMRALLIAVGLLLSLVTVPVFAQDASASPEASASAAPAADTAPAEKAPETPGLFPASAGEKAPEAKLAATFANTSWVLAATALVFFMTLPGLALFYGGLVKKKNVLSIIMQSIGAAAIVGVLWVTVVYSLAFGGSVVTPATDTAAKVTSELIPGFLGNFDMAFLNGVSTGSAASFISQPNAPVFDLAFVMFQAMFAIITPALIIGAFAERLKFGHFVGFIIAWMFLVYAPVAHAVWHPLGYFYNRGALDFAGGTVVHINAGIAGLVAAIVLGKRNKLKPNPPHNLVFTVMGAAMLWFGWFGFNAGSALAADGIASNALMTTNTATAMAAIVWFVLDWIFNKKPTVLGAVSGAVAGLVAITPAAGFVNVSGALIIGALAALVCYIMVVFVKSKLGYDDSLDCFGIHGIGGITGALLTGVLADPRVWAPYGGAYAGTAYGKADQFGIQLETVLFTIAITGVFSFIIFGVIKLLKGKASDTEQAVGLDIVEHNERAYTVIE